EQARGERNVGPAADVFSLGCVLYECLTGTPTFSGHHVIAILTKVLFEDVEPPSKSANVPQQLSDLVMRMLAKSPAQRPADGRAVAAQLDACEPTYLAPASELAPALGKKEMRLVSVIMTNASLAETAPTLEAASARSFEEAQ